MNRYRFILFLALSVAEVPLIALADDDLGVTMRMVVDDEISSRVLREIPLPARDLNTERQARPSDPGPPDLDRRGRSADALERARERRSERGGDRPADPRGPERP